MNDLSPGSQELTLTRRFAHPRAKVFEAFIQRDAFAAWIGPMGMHAASAEVDARPGGSYDMMLVRDDGREGRHHVRGTYREVAAPERLVFTWQWVNEDGPGPETLVTLTFAEASGGTELRLHHTLLPSVEFDGAASRRLGQHARQPRGLPRNRLTPQSGATTMSKPILYGSPLSPFVRTVRIACAEKGVDIDLQEADLKAPDYEAIHPFRRMPAWRHGDVHLFEMLGIVTYVSRAFDGPALIPADAAGLARCLQWVSVHNDYIASDLIRSIIVERLVMPRFFGIASDEARIAEALPRAEHAFDVLDRALAASPYLAGDQATLADFAMLPAIFYAGLTPDTKEGVAGRRHLMAWQERMSARPSVQATVPQFD